MDQDTLEAVYKALGIQVLSSTQWEFLSSTKSRRLLAGGVRSAKTWTQSLDFTIGIIDDLYSGVTKPGDVYWIMGPTYEKTRRDFGLVRDWLMKMRLVNPDGFSTNVNPGWIRLNACPCGSSGCRHDRVQILTKSSDDTDALAMDPPRRIAMTEPALGSYDAYLKAEERLVESGGQLTLAGTFENSIDWYADLFEAWKRPETMLGEDAQAWSIATFENLVTYPLGEADPRIQAIKKKFSKERYSERILGRPMPPRGRVFDEFSNLIHTGKVEFVEGQPVVFGIDPGFSRATESAYAVVFWQSVNNQIRIFDEIYVQELYGKEVCQLATQKPWWNSAEKVAFVDGNAGPLNAQIEVWMEHAGVTPRPVRVPILEGNERLHSLMTVNPLSGYPSIVMDRPRMEKDERLGCWGLVSEMGGVRNPFTDPPQPKIYSFQKDQNGNVIGKNPVDKYNHAVKALIYSIIGQYGFAKDIPGSSSMSHLREVQYAR